MQKSSQTGIITLYIYFWRRINPETIAEAFNTLIEKYLQQR